MHNGIRYDVDSTISLTPEEAEKLSDYVGRGLEEFNANNLSLKIVEKNDEKAE